MNMKKWTTPMAMEECFTANVDVAVTTCYKIACNTRAANLYEGINHLFDDPFGRIHQECGDENNQVVVVDDKNNITGMKKLKHNGSGGVEVLPCETFEDSGYTVKGSPGPLQVGKTVYWRTNDTGKVFSHQGKLQLVLANKKSMS